MSDRIAAYLTSQAFLAANFSLPSGRLSICDSSSFAIRIFALTSADGSARRSRRRFGLRSWRNRRLIACQTARKNSRLRRLGSSSTPRSCLTWSCTKDGLIPSTITRPTPTGSDLSGPHFTGASFPLEQLKCLADFHGACPSPSRHRIPWTEFIDTYQLSKNVYEGRQEIVLDFK